MRDDLPNAETTRFLGVNFAHWTPRLLAQAIAARAQGAPFLSIVTPNVDHVVRLDRDPHFSDIYFRADIVVNDSRVLRRLARFVGKRLSLCCGSDLTEELVARALPREAPITIIGGDAALPSLLAERYGLTRVRHYNPPMGFIHDRAEVDKCLAFAAARPGVVTFLAVGSPRQEILSDLLRVYPGMTGIGLNIGASFDFLTGYQRRAPNWMQAMGLEWLHRLATQPRRLAKRYLLDGPRIILRLWRTEIAKR